MIFLETDPKNIPQDVADLRGLNGSTIGMRGVLEKGFKPDHIHWSTRNQPWILRNMPGFIRELFPQLHERHLRKHGLKVEYKRESKGTIYYLDQDADFPVEELLAHGDGIDFRPKVVTRGALIDSEDTFINGTRVEDDRFDIDFPQWNQLFWAKEFEFGEEDRPLIAAMLEERIDKKVIGS